MSRQKWTEERARKLCQDKEGELLEFKRDDKNLYYASIRCKRNHTWRAECGSLRSGHWCRKCYLVELFEKEFFKVKTICAEKGGKCLSTEYNGHDKDGEFECRRGHKWTTIFNLVKNGSWCLECYRLDLAEQHFEEIKEICREKGGKCHSTEYLGARDYGMFECARGHTWTTLFGSIKRGAWCGDCYYADLADRGLLEIKEICLQKGGKYLSNKYLGSDGDGIFECSRGHIWTSKNSSVKRGSWCDDCYYIERAEWYFERVKRICIEKGGKCLSTSYKEQFEYGKFECGLGHIWDTMYVHITQGSWCPHCRFKSEQCCRGILEELFLREFPHKKPKWLENLELDMYCEELSIACEYNGKQHYQIVPFFHDEEEFKAQVERDTRKYQICKDKGIHLIIVPYTYNYQNPQEMRKYIVEQCTQLGLIKRHIIPQALPSPGENN